MAIQLQRVYRFSASHLYRRPDWSDAENLRRFGKCARLPGHGHNYRLTVAVAGEVEPSTGFVVDLGELDRLVAERILEPLDHSHLNEAVPEFAAGRAIPSSENLVIWVRNRLQDGLPRGCRLVGIRVAEDDDLAAEWRADPA
jgi:6-pyruvoyltetrahydropterin/6-carboxytetrahydropterin synthase